MQTMFQGSSNRHGSSQRRGDHGLERVSRQCSPVSGLHQEASSLLSQPGSMEAFRSRISPASGASLETAATHAQNPETLRSMNCTTDQIANMLEINPIEELFCALRERDRSQAVDLAVRDCTMQRWALEQDDAFKTEVLTRIGATATA